MSSNFFAALDDSDDDGPTAPVVASKPNNKQSPVKSAEVVEPSKPDERRRPQNNDRNTKFGRGGRAPAREGKRDYDRRSGTGRGKEIKKDGGGAHNWGSDKNEARNPLGQVYEEEAIADENAPAVSNNIAESEALEEGTTIEGEQTPEPTPEPEPEPEPEDKTMSYEEYMAQKKEKEASALLAPVKPRDFIEDEFKNAKPAQAVEEDFLVMGGGKQKRNRDKKAEKKSPDDVSTLNAAELLSFRAATEFDRRDGGRGRGRDRGREGGRDGGRGRNGSFGEREGGREGVYVEREGRYGGRGDREGRFGGRGDREGGYSGRGDREGGYSGRGDREGGYRGRGDREVGYSGRGDREGGYSGRGDREGGYGGRGGRDGGYGGRGGRGGREGGRGGRDGYPGGRDGYRAGRSRGRGGRGRSEINVLDETAFPAL